MNTKETPAPRIVGLDTDADRVRFIACYNACAGMADPATEIGELRREHARLAEFSGQAAAEIAALREALRLAESELDLLLRSGSQSCGTSGVLVTVRTALAKATGGKS